MAVHYSGGVGVLYNKGTDENLAKVAYQLIETDPTKYTKKKWWGDFSIKKELKQLGNYVIEFEDSRKGECIISNNTLTGKRIASRYYYTFFGRGPLGRRISFKR